uniref:Uncharacterized protein n=1 Tax=Strombidium inclinatum TaxID=197538 RepID=A0A7S3MYC2_9SPIT|mmetsp:Transcript_29368/g.44340  ORF Transcript_29368/g.44340 Transcript_29368/m.44340 type:complete len:226 (+) Transcript_29368:1168-1845(+)
MDDDDEPLDPNYVLQEFQRLFEEDEQLRDLLGDANGYSVEEKESIIKAYKKGGGVAGLADIIDDEEEEDGSQAVQPGMDDENGDAEETEINLDDPEDVKIIEEEFKKLFDRDENFRKSFGEEAFDLAPIQKYQIIDAYGKGGMQEVLGLLSSSADPSGIISQHEDPDMPEEDLSKVYHNGKVYNRIQIEDLGEDDEYLMDENGDIYTQDFKFIINMGENVEIEAD